jgi:hypothetical protein
MSLNMNSFLCPKRRVDLVDRYIDGQVELSDFITQMENKFKDKKNKHKSRLNNEKSHLTIEQFLNH